MAFLLDAERRAIHYFSLLHASALITLSQTGGQIYGSMEPISCRIINRLETIPSAWLHAIASITGFYSQDF